MENQPSIFSKSEILTSLSYRLRTTLKLNKEEYVRVRSFLIFAFNHVDEMHEVLELFPMIYADASGNGPAHLKEHPTYLFITRKFVML